ncbi:MAG: hypothetical protein E6H04_08145 [Bacillati bacterium ANGP1]|uniref:Uncharacterized protein n=1 Tax=Candidatus Segetimicrobium genomatis TaxID=2569760 RepID=A0A537JB03_9BACT|nr:MAG: hypothetical protein E6H04_08145 [Terrabacteria group bacterium ANGP1]
MPKLRANETRGGPAIGPAEFPNYAAASWGPEAADALIARDGRRWMLPTVLEVPRGGNHGR